MPFSCYERSYSILRCYTHSDIINFYSIIFITVVIILPRKQAVGRRRPTDEQASRMRAVCKLIARPPCVGRTNSILNVRVVFQ